jgi:hypothetical protein
MTDLQISLIIIGLLIVAAVFSYNKWQEYKARKSVDRAFSTAHDDVLMSPGKGASGTVDRTEPSFSNSNEYSPPHDVGEPHETHHGVAFEEPVQDAPEQPKTVMQSRNLPVDELVDCIIPIALNAPMRGEKLLQSFQHVRHIGNKPVHLIGQDLNGNWETIAHGGVYGAVRAGVQLANRNSALNEIEYSEVVMQLRQIADNLDAELDVPDMPKVITSARALHQFVSAYDAQLSVNVRSNGAPWAVSTLLAALTRQGFDLRPDGRLVMPDGDGGALFTLSTNVAPGAETTSLLTLLLNVPCVSPERDGFGAMIACARMLATRLHGTIVDDSGQPLDDAALAEIAGQVSVFYEDMQTADILAGSQRALRLFS